MKLWLVICDNYIDLIIRAETEPRAIELAINVEDVTIIHECVELPTDGPEEILQTIIT